LSVKKIILITGSYAPDICGVGDYTKQLFENLNKSFLTHSLELKIIRDWSFSNFIRIIKSFNCKNDILHIQYPTDGYGYSLLPMFLFILLKCEKRIVTIHEFSQRTLKAKLATSLFFFFSDYIIFTTDFERNNIIRLFPFVKRKSSVINIASNIKASTNKIEWIDRDFDIAYFGHFRPNKGLEDFKRISEELRSLNNGIKVALIGQLQERFENYFVSNFDNDQFEIFLNLPDFEVSDLLQNTKVLLLPFPDGISLRRGSFLAGIENDCEIISYTGKFDDGLNKISHLFSPNDSEKHIAYKINDILTNRQSRISQEIVSDFKSKISWNLICEHHSAIYE
jgi:glycosyltransferase involved in cell wall biosynthesis